MPGIYDSDGTSYHFDQDKCRIIFEGMKVTFLLKPEFAHRNRPTKMILDYATKDFYEEFDDGYSCVNKFVGMI